MPHRAGKSRLEANQHSEATSLKQKFSYPRIAGLGQALLSAFQTALVGRSREPGVARHRSSISKFPRQNLGMASDLSKLDLLVVQIDDIHMTGDRSSNAISLPGAV